ncbi:hypothetical protein HRbin27_00354 [bacterium HR27]|nr:hypothetical protein HRbin27_00354 [bacterium HR27]
MIGIDVGARRCHWHDTTTETTEALTTEETIAKLTMLAPTTIVLELTGPYGRRIAEIAYQAGHTVLIAHDTDSAALRTLLRNRRKTDKLDARLLAQLAQLELPGPNPHLTPYEHIRPLLEARALAHQWRYLVQLRTAIRTRNKNPLTEPIPLEKPLTELIEHYKRRTIETVPPTTLQLLTSIPGVSPTLAALLYVQLGDIHRFRNRDAAVSYAGVAPRHTPLSGNTRQRPRRYRHAKLLITHLHMYALHVAREPDQFDAIGQTYVRIRNRAGARRALHAVKRHLIRIVYGVLKSGQPYSSSRAADEASA